MESSHVVVRSKLVNIGVIGWIVVEISSGVGNVCPGTCSKIKKNISRPKTR